MRWLKPQFPLFENEGPLLGNLFNALARALDGQPPRVLCRAIAADWAFAASRILCRELQIKAPRSINAELCRRPPLSGSSLRATSLRNVRPAALSTGFDEFHNRARTRAIFASITGSAASNAKDAMAAAVFITHPWQTAQGLHRTRDFPFRLLDNGYCGPVKIPRAAVNIPGPAKARGCPVPQPGRECQASGILPSNAEDRESPPSPSFAAA